MENNLAPIVLFTYRRVPIETIESLLQSDLVSQSELFIYSDGYKSEVDKSDVLEVREYLKTIEGFKDIKIIEAPKNKGLANSIISGVTEVINKYEKAIVLEDDVIISTDFLEYMNNSLDFYEENENIWSISGYTPNLESLKNYHKDIYLSLRATSWVWGTWKNRWDKIDWSIQDWDNFKVDKKEQLIFEKSGNDMFKMLELQMLGKLDSWAIRWCYNQFRFSSYTIHPRCSKALNIGFNDEKASNTSGTKWTIFDVEICNNKLNLEKVSLEQNILKELKEIYDLRLYTKIGYFLKKFGGYKMAKKLIRNLKGV